MCIDYSVVDFSRLQSKYQISILLCCVFVVCTVVLDFNTCRLSLSADGPINVLGYKLHCSVTDCW